MASVLYLSYTGLAEPLGRSQVLGYLEGLVSNHDICVVSFEKSEDFDDSTKMEELRLRCKEFGIKWLPFRYHKNPRFLATAIDLLNMSRLVLGHGRRIDIVHARGYLPAFAALAGRFLFRRPVIFDMRAFWPDEMVTAGRLRQSSLLYRILKWAEHQCLLRSEAIVTLTEAAATYLKDQPEYVGRRIDVIPTCADLDRFSPAPTRSAAVDSQLPFVIGCCGTVGSGWFRVDWLVAFYRALKRVRPDARLRVVTRDEPSVVLDEARRQGADMSGIEIYGRPFDKMADEIRQFDGSVMFFSSDFSKLGSSPTRMAELLGCGVACVANAGVGDVATIIERYRVGVLADGADDTAMDRAVGEFMELLQDPELSQRCRQAAQEWFSLESGVARYDALYRQLSPGHAGEAR